MRVVESGAGTGAAATQGARTGHKSWPRAKLAKSPPGHPVLSLVQSMWPPRVSNGGAVMDATHQVYAFRRGPPWFYEQMEAIILASPFT